MLIRLICETIKDKTGENCPGKPTNILYEGNEVFCLCNRCYQRYERTQLYSRIRKYKADNENASLRTIGREFNISYGIVEKALRS